MTEQPKSQQKDKDAPAKKPARKRKNSQVVPTGIACVRATFNNTIVTITDPVGRVLATASAGTAGYSGSRKSSGFAATVAAQNAARTALTQGMREVEVVLNGPGAGRESAVRGLMSGGLAVMTIRDATNVPHNGCRARKRRRV